MKVRSSVRLMCKDCYILRREGKLRVQCKNARLAGKHKQVQG